MPINYCPGCGMRIGSTNDVLSSSRRQNTSSIDVKKPKRKLSAWNKYVKANSKKPRFRMRNGKINLRKMGVSFRKTPAGRKK